MMIQWIIWKAFGFVYGKVFKPIVFLLSPDAAHEQTVKFISRMGKYTWFRWLTRVVFKLKRNTVLNQTINGLKFDNPVGLSAGFDKNGEVVPAISNLGFGFGEVGSVTAEMCVGNPKPWFYRLPKTKSLVVNAGLANDGSSAILSRIKENKNRVHKHYVTILSVAKANDESCVSVEDGIRDYVTTLKRASDNKQIGALEINISCPNTYGGEPFTTSDNLDKLLRAVSRLKIKKPIFIKMPSNLTWPESKELIEIIVKHKLAGVTVANLSKTRDKVNPEDKLPDTVKGSLSGMPAWESSNELIRNIFLGYGNELTIIGVGGIFSAEDAYTKIRLGASLVEFITGMIFVGPQLASEINYGLIRSLKRDGFTNISQAIGVDARA